MTRQAALDRLSAELPTLRRIYDVRDLAIFGSVARDEAREGSDLDVMVTFEGPPTFAHFMDLGFYLEDMLGVKIDLTTQKSLRPELRPQIEREAIHVS